MNFLKRLGAAVAGLAVAVVGGFVEASLIAPIFVLGLAAAGASLVSGSAAPFAIYGTIIMSPYLLADKLLGYAVTGEFKSLVGAGIDKASKAIDAHKNNSTISPPNRRGA